jgi:hypothetical protein
MRRLILATMALSFFFAAANLCFAPADNHAPQLIINGMDIPSGIWTLSDLDGIQSITIDNYENRFTSFDMNSSSTSANLSFNLYNGANFNPFTIHLATNLNYSTAFFPYYYDIMGSSSNGLLNLDVSGGLSQDNLQWLTQFKDVQTNQTYTFTTPDESSTIALLGIGMGWGLVFFFVSKSRQKS